MQTPPERRRHLAESTATGLRQIERARVEALTLAIPTLQILSSKAGAKWGDFQNARRFKGDGYSLTAGLERVPYPAPEADSQDPSEIGRSAARVWVRRYSRGDVARLAGPCVQMDIHQFKRVRVSARQLDQRIQQFE